MDEFAMLLEKFWILRENDSADYFKVKRTVNKQMKEFVNQFPGWKLIITNELIKLEKIPAEAHPFMGIQNFKEVNDYCFLCTLLLFLDDKADGDKFLLSELISGIEVRLSGKIDIDFTRFTDRKSLVRVLKFAESMHLLKIWEGSTERLEYDRNQEILYENTGLSDYFSVNFDKNISDYTSSHDFENHDSAYSDGEKGFPRTNRVYRRLLLQPAMYWNSREDVDSIYLKNQRTSVAGHLETYLNGRLDVHNGAAFYMLHEDSIFGRVHPAENSVSGFTALLCGALREELYTQQTETNISFEVFRQMLLRYRAVWGKGLSKLLREMSDDKFTDIIEAYMLDWMLIERTATGYTLCDGIFKTIGVFPKDYLNSEEEK
ncbi:MAG: TIGR02678 family protein [Ruminococcus sp.]|nr:TIGR02678 family protein [Ruminococcus sp.]